MSSYHIMSCHINLIIHIIYLSSTPMAMERGFWGSNVMSKEKLKKLLHETKGGLRDQEKEVSLTKINEKDGENK